MLGDRELQLQYEQDADASAQAERLQTLLSGSREGSVELPRASVLISRMYAEVMRELEAVASVKTRGAGGKYKTWLRALPLDVAAVISIRECIKLCTSHTHATHVHGQDLALAVGKLFELEVRIRQAEAVNPVYMDRIKAQLKENATTNLGHIRKLYNVAIDRVMKGEIEFSLSKTDMIHIGKFGVDACLNAGLLEMHRGTNKSGKTVEYVLAPEINEFLTGYTVNDVRNVVNKEESRMLCAPDPWTTLHDGGYLSTRRKAAAPLMGLRGIRKSVRAEVAACFTSERMPMVFEAGNYMQATAFTIHDATRQAIQRVWQAGGGVLGVPHKDAPKRPEMPLGPDWVKEGAPESELAIFGRWKRQVVRYYQEFREWRAKVREIGGFFRVSGNTDEPIWFPMYFDKRGRWYYRGMPNPQGSDLAKAVLHFHEKKPLGSDGVFWLKVHIANSYGFDKERFENRARWTEQNWPLIEKALDNPEDHPDVWGTDAPWCMFTAAYELREAYRSGNPATYCTGVPVHMDATCSGLQHFSALLRDPVGGQYVNLTDPLKCGPKQDIYARVAANALLAVQADLKSTNVEEAAMAVWWLQTGIPRGLAKKPVMTYVYGATLKGTADFIEDYVNSKMKLPWPDENKSYHYSMYAAKKLFAGIAATVPAAAEAMRWLRNVAAQQPNGQRMQWTTPTGFKVQHDYQGQNDVRVWLNSCGVSTMIVREVTEDTRPIAMQNAIAPNFVHAMDASHLTLTALQMRDRDLSIVAIHDSFGTHPCDVQTMHECIRSSFVDLYEDRNILGEFLWEVNGIGEVPTRGSLDLKEILSSEFFFC